MRSIEQAFDPRPYHSGVHHSGGAMQHTMTIRAPRPAASVRRAARLTRRGRAVVVLAMLVVLVIAGFTLGRASSQAAGPSAHRPLPTVTVAPGETLWQIAARVDPGADRRALIDQIEALNHLHGGMVVAGQQLRLPRTH